MRAFFECSVVALSPINPEYSTPPPYSSFLHALSLVSTRAFVIDMYHTIALVPFADILNHSARPHTALQSDQFVCHVCGALGTCEHDIMNADGIARRLEDLSDEYRQELERAWRSRSARGDTVDMLVENDDLRPGQEVFNSYGEDISNARLLVEWAFILDEEMGMDVMSFDPPGVSDDQGQTAEHHRYLCMAASAALRLSRNGSMVADHPEEDDTDGSDEDEDDDEDDVSDNGSQEPDPTARTAVAALLYNPEPSDSPSRCISSSGLNSIGLFVDAILDVHPAPLALTPQQIVKAAQLVGAALSRQSQTDEATGSPPAFGRDDDATLSRNGIAKLLTILQDRLASLHGSPHPLNSLQAQRDVSIWVTTRSSELS